MNYYFLLFIFCPVCVITGLLTDISKDQSSVKPFRHTDELEGTWNVDYSFNQIDWEMKASKGISHQWYEKIIFKKDTFCLEDHEWWPPRKSNNGTEYFPYEGKKFIRGTHNIKSDILFLDGYYTDYLYSDNTADSHKYIKTFTYKINADTLELSVNAAIKYRLIRKNK